LNWLSTGRLTYNEVEISRRIMWLETKADGMAESRPYTKEFYGDIDEGSLRSADELVPQG
jgi:hypothetical protein